MQSQPDSPDNNSSDDHSFAFSGGGIVKGMNVKGMKSKGEIRNGESSFRRVASSAERKQKFGKQKSLSGVQKAMCALRPAPFQLSAFFDSSDNNSSVDHSFAFSWRGIVKGMNVKGMGDRGMVTGE